MPIRIRLTDPFATASTLHAIGGLRREPTDQARQVLATAAGGALAADQAATLIGALAGIARIAETDELRDRIERLEAAADVEPRR